MTNWKKVKFSECLSNIVDNRGRTCPTAKTGIPLIATNCVKNDSLFPVFENIRHVDKDTYDNWFRAHPKPGDMLFVLKGSPGRVCWTPDPINFCIAQDMLAIRANESIVNSKFLFALLRSSEVQQLIENLHVGSLIPHFKKGDFDQLTLTIPEDIGVQKKIGDIYFNLCKKIELNRQMNHTLEQMAQALFKKYFVDDIDPENLPEGWRISKLEGLISINEDSISKDFPFEYIEYYDTSSVTENHFSSPITYDLQNAPSRAKRILKDKDIIYSTVRPNQKHYGIFRRPKPNTIASTGFAVLRAKKIEPHFLYFLLTQKNITEYLNGIAEASATTFPAFNPSLINEMEVVIPPKVLMQKFETSVNALFEKVYLNQIENRTLTNLRDSLLPKLMSGEIEIKEAETIMA